MKTFVRNQRGVSLLEVLMVMLLVGILAAVAITSMTSSVDDQAFAETIRRMNMVRAGIVGDLDSQTRTVRDSFGYWGDVGALPASLNDLITRPATVSAYSYDTTKRVGSGWNGPYLPTSDPNIDYTKDAWGNSFVWTPGASPPTLVSLGSDGAVGGTGLAQDITIQFPTSLLYSTVTGFLYNGTIGVAADVASTEHLYYPNGTGGITTVTTTTAVGQACTGCFSFSNIPAGPRSLDITANSTTVGPFLFSIDRANYTIPSKDTNMTLLGGSCPGTTIQFEFATSSNLESNPTATFNVIASNTCIYPMTANYATANGTATAGVNYTAASGTVTIPAGSLSSTITVTIINDGVANANLTYTITLSNPSPTGLTLGANTTLTDTIVDTNGSSCTGASVTYDSTGTFTVPPACTKLTVYSWGAGGGGGGASAKAGNGGAGGYAYTNQFAVTPGETFSATIGGGGGGGSGGCTAGGAGTYAGGTGGIAATGGAGGGTGAGGGVGNGNGTAFNGGLGKYGGGGGGGTSAAGNDGGTGGAATVVVRNTGSVTLLIAGGGGGGGGGAAGGGTAGGTGGPGCAQAGANGGTNRGGGGGGGACSGTNTANGVGTTPSNSASAGTRGAGGTGSSKCNTSGGTNGRVIFTYAP